MLPYYCFPFEYGYRNWMRMEQAPIQQPVQMPVMEEFPEDLPEEEPVQEPVTEVQSVQQNIPQMMPIQQNIPQMLPIQQNMPQVMPVQQNMPQMMPVQQNMPQVMPVQQNMPQYMPNQQVMPTVNYPPVLPYQQNMPVNPYPNVMMPGYEMQEPVNFSEGRRPLLSDNPAVPSITLFKELTAYANYGNPSGNADILYTGDRGVWTFELPALLGALTNQRAQIVIRGVLDDNYDVNVNRYSANITVNGTRVHTGRLPLVHGRPFGQRFNNWRELTFNVRNLRRNNRIVIENSSNTGPDNWIAFDWMELRILPR